MPETSRYVPGAWNAICDMCGQQFKNYELTKNWKGLMVCAKDYEPRHPQDFVHGIPDNMTPAWVRPPPKDNFVTTGTAFIATEGIAGQAIPGNLF